MAGPEATFNGITYNAETRRAVENGVARPFTPEEDATIPSWEDMQLHQAEVQEHQEHLEAAESLRVAMFNLTDAIIDWCESAQAFLYTGGAHGSFDPMAFMALLQQAEGLLLQHKVLPLKTQPVNDQRDWMLQRGQQAQSILALAAVMS